MKKILMIASALMFVASVSLSAAPAYAAEPSTKKVCHVQHGKEVCKTVKVHTKQAKKKKK